MTYGEECLIKNFGFSSKPPIYGKQPTNATELGVKFYIRSSITFLDACNVAVL